MIVIIILRSNHEQLRKMFEKKETAAEDFNPS